MAFLLPARAPLMAPLHTPANPQGAEVRAELLAQYCQHLPAALASSQLVALIYAASQWGTHSRTLALLWLTASVLQGLWRTYLWLQHRRQMAADAEEQCRLWPAHRLGSLASGLVWGSATLALYSTTDPASQLILAFALAGVTAAATNTMAADRLAATFFQTAALGPLALRLFWQGGPTPVGVGLMSLLYLAFLVNTARRLNAQLLESIGMRREALERERALRESELRYRQQAQTDALTGLPNRHSLYQRLPELLAEPGQAGRIALMYLDVDNFKDLNDSHGHGFGDRVLQGIAERLRLSVRPGDLVVRMGGDEFVVIARDLQAAGEAEALATRILADLQAPIVAGAIGAQVRASIGIGIYPQDGADAEQLMKNADIALYQAKDRGRGRLQFYSREMNDTLRQRLFIEQELRLALQSDQLYLEYQPLIDLHSDAAPELEALLRWRHPQRGELSPAQFIPIAEGCGLMGELGELVLRRVCQQLRAWQDELVPLVPVSVNVSAHQFETGRLTELITGIAREYQIDPRLLRVEITESALMQHSGNVLATLQELRSLGIRISIDDFGTGYSSLSYLKHLPIDCLKIDRSFIHDMTSDPRDVALVRGIISIGRSLSLRVVAEGVETRRQAALLRELRCDAAQGYFFHRPLDATCCRALLSTLAERRTIADTLRAPALHAVDAPPAEQSAC